MIFTWLPIRYFSVFSGTVSKLLAKVSELRVCVAATVRIVERDVQEEVLGSMLKSSGLHLSFFQLSQY
jgi:hypothetical protein